MGFTAAGVALIIAIILLCLFIFKMRHPKDYNARETVLERTGAVPVRRSRRKRRHA